MSENTETSKSRDNLIEWKPGQSGNPNGRPKGAKTGLRARLIRLLEKEASPDVLALLEAKGISLDDKANAEVLSHVLLRAGLKGDLRAIKLAIEQTESPMPKEVKLEGGERPIKLFNIVGVVADSEVNGSDPVH